MSSSLRSFWFFVVFIFFLSFGLFFIRILCSFSFDVLGMGMVGEAGNGDNRVVHGSHFWLHF